MDCENERDEETGYRDDTEILYRCDTNGGAEMDDKQNVDGDADTRDFIPMEEDSHTRENASSPPSSPPPSNSRLIKPTISAGPSKLSEHLSDPREEEGLIECEDVSSHPIRYNNYSSDEEDTGRLHSPKVPGRRSNSRESIRPRSSSDITIRQVGSLEDSKSNFKRNRQPSDRSVISRRSKSSSPPRREIPNKQYRRSFKDNVKAGRGRYSPRDKQYFGGALRNRNGGGGRRSRSGSRERNSNNNTHRNSTDKHINNHRNFRRGNEQRPGSWSGYKNHRQYNVSFTEKEPVDEHRSEQQGRQTNSNQTNETNSAMQSTESHDTVDQHRAISSSSNSSSTAGLLHAGSMVVSNNALALRDKQWEDTMRQQAQEFQQQKDYVINTLMTLTKNVISWPSPSIHPEAHAAGVGNQPNYAQTSFPSMTLGAANNPLFAPTYSHIPYPTATSLPHSSLLQHPLLMVASPTSSALMSVPSIHSSAITNNASSSVSNHPTDIGNQANSNVTTNHRSGSTDTSSSKDSSFGKSG